MTANGVLGILYVMAAFAMLWSNQKITTQAGFCTPSARWALVRRAIYLSMAMSLCEIGWRRLNGDYVGDWIDTLSMGVIAFGILIFPMLRAFGLITQDIIVNGQPPSYPQVRRRPF